MPTSLSPLADISLLLNSLLTVNKSSTRLTGKQIQSLLMTKVMIQVMTTKTAEFVYSGLPAIGLKQSSVKTLKIPKSYLISNLMRKKQTSHTLKPHFHPSSSHKVLHFVMKRMQQLLLFHQNRRINKHLYMCQKSYEDGERQENSESGSTTEQIFVTDQSFRESLLRQTT